MACTVASRALSSNESSPGCRKGLSIGKQTSSTRIGPSNPHGRILGPCNQRRNDSRRRDMEWLCLHKDETVGDEITRLATGAPALPSSSIPRRVLSAVGCCDGPGPSAPAAIWGGAVHVPAGAAVVPDARDRLLRIRRPAR